MKTIKTFLFVSVFALLSTSCATGTGGGLGGILDQASKVLTPGAGGLTTDEIVAGLKEALRVGIDTGSTNASKVDGYFKHPVIKIPFPADVQKVEARLRQAGLGNEVDKFVLSLNRAAEDAAKQAKPIFWTAIKSMTISDAISILKGEKNAATTYLRKVTYNELYSQFSPVVQQALGKHNATKYYGDVIGLYNKIPFVTQVNADLNKYATDKAIDGLFYLVEQEERKIRENPVARVTDILKKVFANQ